MDAKRSSVATAPGEASREVLPLPSWPRSFPPQQNALPLAITRQVCAPPAAMATRVLGADANTGFGAAGIEATTLSARTGVTTVSSAAACSSTIDGGWTKRRVWSAGGGTTIRLAGKGASSGAAYFAESPALGAPAGACAGVPACTAASTSPLDRYGMRVRDCDAERMMPSGTSASAPTTAAPIATRRLVADAGRSYSDTAISCS